MSSEGQGHIKFKVKCKEIDIFVFCKCFCDLCVTRMVRLQLEGILVLALFSHCVKLSEKKPKNVQNILSGM